MFEDVANETLQNFLFDNKMISTSHFGFRPVHSGPDALATASHIWDKALNGKGGKRGVMRVVALDVKGVFGKAWHKAVFVKLRIGRDSRKAVGISRELFAGPEDSRHCLWSEIRREVCCSRGCAGIYPWPPVAFYKEDSAAGWSLAQGCSYSRF